jgi:hypothetical protein
MATMRLTRRSVLKSAAVATGGLVTPFVHGAYAAGKLSCGFWDHWVPGANGFLPKFRTVSAAPAHPAWAERLSSSLRLSDNLPTANRRSGQRPDQGAWQAVARLRIYRSAEGPMGRGPDRAPDHRADPVQTGTGKTAAFALPIPPTPRRPSTTSGAANQPGPLASVVSLTGDRGFESFSLQQRVCKLSVPERRTDRREDNVAVVSRNFLFCPRPPGCGYVSTGGGARCSQRLWAAEVGHRWWRQCPPWLRLGEVAFGRTLFAFLTVAAIILPRAGWSVLRTRRYREHLQRGPSQFGSMLCWFLAVSVLSLGSANGDRLRGAIVHDPAVDRDPVSSSGSHTTLRWRKVDSNHRSRPQRESFSTALGRCAPRAACSF